MAVRVQIVLREREKTVTDRSEQHKGKDHANSKGCKSSEGYGRAG